MCKALDDMRKHAHIAGIEKGIEKGIEEGVLTSIAALMKTMSWSSAEAMDALKIPLNERSSYDAKLQ